MIDVALLRDDPQALKASLDRRGLAVDLDALTDLDRRRREIRTRAESLRAEQRQSGKNIATLQGDAKQAAIAAAARVSEEYKASITEADDLDAEFGRIWMTLPNPVHPSVPFGHSDEDNQEIETWGTVPDFGFEPKDHLDLGQALGIIDVDRAVRLSGSRFAYLKGPAAMLEFALIRYAMDHLLEAGFTPVVPPVLVREEAVFGTGFFPAGREQVYAVGVDASGSGEVEPDALYLAATAEIPLAGLHMDELLDGADLPLRYAGFSTCFRREAGTYGKDTRGMFRVHQFDKVEMFSYALPERTWEEHAYLVAQEEKIVRGLEIPYRMVNVCTGDLGDPAAKKIDLEAWMPGQGRYREITSCSNTTDFQARRLRIRYKDAGGDNHLVHTLNGTAVAVGRTLIALLENHQQADGSVRIPAALVPYAGFEQIGP
ncbi:MAG: serine--tRNA ligase [Actinobacteria bacterium]|nr:serine--tRNA ligase [Actinomycetota bacterium]